MKRYRLGRLLIPAETPSESASKIYDRELLQQIWPFIRPHKSLLLLAMLMVFAGMIANVVHPILMKLAIDQAIIPRDLKRLFPITAVLFGVLIFGRLVLYLQTLLLQISGQRAMHSLRTAVHGHLLSMRIAYFERQAVGRLVTRVTNDIESMADAFSQGII